MKSFDNRTQLIFIFNKGREMRILIVLSLLLNSLAFANGESHGDLSCKVDSTIKNIEKKIDRIMGKRHTYGHLLTRDFDYDKVGLHDLRKIESMYTKTYALAGLVSIFPIYDASVLTGASVVIGGYFVRSVLNPKLISNIWRFFVYHLEGGLFAALTGYYTGIAGSVSYSALYMSAIIQSYKKYEAGEVDVLDISDEDIVLAMEEIDDNYTKTIDQIDKRYNEFINREKKSGPIDDVVERIKDMRATISMFEVKVEAMKYKKFLYQYLQRVVGTSASCYY